MAPAKQSILPFHSFFKNPSKSTKKKHEKLEKKLAASRSKKPYVDKKAVQRMKEEEDLDSGSKGWRDFLAAKGVKNPSSFRCDLMYLGNGAAPDPTAPYPKEDVDLDLEPKKYVPDADDV